ncbi:hypothetical protein CQA40_09320 [Helicobacter sp. MIT 01-3238]|nr:hypothetical protein CQA40_09320 [Helicobacter sp. MIT 01-3238]
MTIGRGLLKNFGFILDCHANANAFARNDGVVATTRILADSLAMTSFWIAISCPKGKTRNDK